MSGSVLTSFTEGLRDPIISRWGKRSRLSPQLRGIIARHRGRQDEGAHRATGSPQAPGRFLHRARLPYRRRPG